MSPALPCPNLTPLSQAPVSVIKLSPVSLCRGDEKAAHVTLPDGTEVVITDMVLLRDLLQYQRARNVGFMDAMAGTSLVSGVGPCVMDWQQFMFGVS